MKKLEAIITRHKLEEVKDALVSIGVEEMSITEVEGFENHVGLSRVFRGVEYKVGFVPKIKVELVLADAMVEQAATVIAKANAAAGSSGGRILVVPVEEFPRGIEEKRRSLAAAA